MSEYWNHDPFKPVQPQIPGVPSSGERANRRETFADASSRPTSTEPSPNAPAELPADLRLAWVGLALAGVLTMIFLLLGSSHKAEPEKSSADAAASITRPSPVSESVAPSLEDAKPAVGPGVVATADQLIQPWSAREFSFRDPVTLTETPAMVVRLPGGQLWGFSLRAPYGTCQLEYVTDLGKLDREYDFTASHPMVTDPCSKSVFDLARYGNAPAGLVRGEIVKGSAFRPPLGIEMRTQGDRIIAVRGEQ